VTRSGSTAALCLLAAAAIAAACGDTSPDSDASTVRDSAGIRIVENHRPAASEPWSLEADPIVEIGADERDPTQQLFRVAGAVVLSDGRIVVAHGPDPMVRWYSADGVFERGAGRPGGGPGEFGGAISALWVLRGDTIATWEHPARRMQVFSPSAEYVRQVVLELPHDMPTGAYPQIRGRLHGGFAGFLMTPFERGPIGEVREATWRYVRFHEDGRYAATIAELPGFRTYTRVVQRGGEEFHTGRAGRCSRRSRSRRPQGDRFYYGPGDRYEIAVFDSTGALMLVRKMVEPRPVTSDIAARTGRRRWHVHRTTRCASRMGAQHRRSAGRIHAADAPRHPRGPHRQPVGPELRDGVERVFVVVRLRRGRPVARATSTIPESWQIMDIGSDYVLTLWRDELDVEHVRKHRLRRAYASPE
jgi:hypothetical protein